MEEQKIECLYKLARAFHNTEKREILFYVENNSGVNATAINEALGQFQSNCSQHLRELKQLDLLVSTKDGRKHYYSVSPTYKEKYDLVVKAANEI